MSSQTPTDAQMAHSIAEGYLSHVRSQLYDMLMEKARQYVSVACDRAINDLKPKVEIALNAAERGLQVAIQLQHAK